MTEKKTDYFASGDPLPPLPPPSMLRMEAGELAGFDGRDDWPDAFTPRELATLQYPHDKAAQGRLIRILWPRLGMDIPAVTVTREGHPEGAIERGTAAALFEVAGIEPSELVAAWLGREWQPAQAPESASTNAPSPREASRPDEPNKAKRDKIRAILVRLEEFDPEFSREGMPGRRVDFFELCRAIEHDAFAYVRPATFNDYLPGLCKFKRGARETNYYREIAPRMGVNRIKTT